MESKGAATRVYKDFKPSMEWVREDDSDTLLAYLPGFSKEQLRVQLRARNLIISGERKIQENTWSRFREEFPVSGNCDLNKISSKFEGNILFVTQPKIIIPAPKPVDARPPSQPKIITPTPKSEEAKSTVVAAPKKPADESNTSNTIQPNIEKKELGDGEDDPKRGVEEKAEKSECAEGVCENESKKKTSEADKKVVYGETDKTVLEKYKGAAGAYAMKLKAACNGVNTIAVLVVGVMIGIYVTNIINSWTKA